MRRECRQRFPRHRLQKQKKALVSNPGMHHGTCVTHVPWCMSGSLSRGGGENVPGIPGACATHNFMYLARAHVGGSFKFFKCHHHGCLDNPIFSNLGLCTACWAHSMCHEALWSTPVNRLLSSFNNFQGLVGGKHSHKINIFRLVLQYFPFQVSVIIYCVLSACSPYFLLVGFAVCYSISVKELAKCLINCCKLMWSCSLQWGVNLMDANALTF